MFSGENGIKWPIQNLSHSWDGANWSFYLIYQSCLLQNCVFGGEVLIDLFDIIPSQSERDPDHGKLQGQWLIGSQVQGLDCECIGNQQEI